MLDNLLFMLRMMQPILIIMALTTGLYFITYIATGDLERDINIYKSNKKYHSLKGKKLY